MSVHGRPEGEGLSTDELLDEGYHQWRTLRNLVKTRRRRERSLEMVTDMYHLLEKLAGRLAKMSWQEGRVATDDDEGDGLGDIEALPDERVPMAVLFLDETGGGEALAADAGDMLDKDPEDLLQMIRTLKKNRLEYFQLFLAYLCQGCRQEAEVVRKLLALVRRVSPQLLVSFGLSQADVARKLGEVRATTSAREKRHVEKPLKAAGMRGVLGAGTRGEETRRRCAEAQKGNQNRRKAKLPRPQAEPTNPERKAS